MSHWPVGEPHWVRDRNGRTGRTLADAMAEAVQGGWKATMQLTLLLAVRAGARTAIAVLLLRLAATIIGRR
jgi:hypothetical protein